MKILGREPALWLALAASTIQVVSTFVTELTPEQQGLLNAAVVALFGVLTAWSVDEEKLTPAIVGLAQALLSVAVSFGLQLGAEEQSVLMAAVTAVAAAFVRTQVTVESAGRHALHE